jgi:hypothetical protein
VTLPDELLDILLTSSCPLTLFRMYVILFDELLDMPLTPLRVYVISFNELLNMLLTFCLLIFFSLYVI